jgi:hypothetical protein
LSGLPKLYGREDVNRCDGDTDEDETLKPILELLWLAIPGATKYEDVLTAAGYF